MVVFSPVSNKKYTMAAKFGDLMIESDR